MSALSTFGRQTVTFDPHDSDHRRWLGEFTRTRSWGSCPVKFSMTGSGNTVAQMQLKLLQYYTKKEFNLEA
jgi:hypothetical protein